MSLVKVLSINSLQPTQEKVNRSIVNHYSSQNYLWNLPEVWKINDSFYIADGHHRIFSKYIQTLNHKIKIPVRYHSSKNTLVSKQAYEFLIEELLKNAKEIQKKGIFHIKDLVLS